MGRPYSQDLLEWIVDVAGVTSRRQAAKRFGVEAATAVRWMTALATTGIVAARPQERACRSKLDPHEAFLRGLIAARDDITLGEMRVRLREEHALTVGLGTQWTFLDARDLTYKKTAHATEQDPPDVKAAREAWFEGQPDLDPSRLVFFDETWKATNMARTRGRSLRGEQGRTVGGQGMGMATGMPMTGLTGTCAMGCHNPG